MAFNGFCSTFTHAINIIVINSAMKHNARGPAGSSLPIVLVSICSVPAAKRMKSIAAKAHFLIVCKA
ncbi:hypothetical protein [Kurthia senegalensis]|uniref:hypothetical protein n=1 Tax=Kurthia senegalensis TaxID=1033740 RepID=UPI0002D891F1|nr:hypothetical protein [Kurthia senegalensis]